MDEITLRSLLKTLGLPVAYHHFEKAPRLPYIVYLFSGSSNFGADDKAYLHQPNYQVELYTSKKDPTQEKLIEDLLDEYDIYWEKSELWIESEGLYQVVYEI